MSSIKSTATSLLLASAYWQRSSCSSVIQPSFDTFEEEIPDLKLDKRISCSPQCPQGFYVDQIQMPACTWNCITYTAKTIQVTPSIIAGIATVAAAFIGYAATRRTNQHTGTARRDEDAAFNPFESMVTDLFGTLDHPNITYLDSSNNTLHAILGHNYLEIQDDGEEVTGFLNLVDQNPHLHARADKLTGAKVIYANAKVSGTVEARSFSKYDAQRIGNRVSTNFESVCNHYGRAMCDCLRSGYGDGWTAGMRVEGQANNNGKYQAINCPSSCNVKRNNI